MSVIILYILLRKAPEELLRFESNPLFLLAGAVFFVMLSALGIYSLRDSISRASFRLGLLTLIPGALSLLISFKGYDYLEGYTENLPYTGYLLDRYIASTVPKLQALTIGYVAVGAVFIMLGIRAKKRHL